MKPTVLLFDIDGTLVTTGGAGRRALERAFDRVHGDRDACSHFPFDGMTDRAIVRAGLAALSVEPTGEAIEAVIAAYLESLAAEVASARVYHVHNGIAEALERGREAGCAVGLGTGNVREGARIKLDRVGIWGSFSFGGFGSDHEDRAQLIRRGAERGAALLGEALEDCRVVVIGDTPKDVAAALANGAEAIGVGTGSWKPADLVACGARAAFDDLSQPGALEALLTPE